MRRTIALLMTMAMMILIATSLAMAQNVEACPSSGFCGGTNDFDVLFGGSGENSIYGYDGDDLLGGPAFTDNTTGKDTKFGGTGNDDMWGGPGDDILYGEAGDDVIYGGLMSENGDDNDRSL